MSSLVKHKPAVMTATVDSTVRRSNGSRYGGEFAPRMNGANHNRPRREAGRQE